MNSLNGIGTAATTAGPDAAGGVAAVRLPWRYRLVAWLLRGFYFGRIAPVGAHARPQAHRGGRLVIVSHRNGAMDGYTVLAAFPDLRFLASVQLLRSRFLRLMFEGIPVVRAKDQRRYGLSANAFEDPVQAACAQLRAGGDLAIFPEGTSEWGHAPRRYQRGAARIACAMLDAGVDLEVIPLGLFYSAPDRFRSHAEVMVGAPVSLPPRAGRDDAQWLQQMHETLSLALDAVSVNCPDEVSFAQIQAKACAAMRRGDSLAERLLALQRDLGASSGLMDSGLQSQHPPSRWPRYLGLLMMAALAPILLVAWAAGRKADARNTVTFFRVAAGLAVALVWLPVLLLLACRWPAPVMGGLAMAAMGWALLGVRRWRP